jgi:hypothetical protein
MNRFIKRIVRVERTPIHGQEDISYWEEVEVDDVGGEEQEITKNDLV